MALVAAEGFELANTQWVDFSNCTTSIQSGGRTGNYMLQSWASGGYWFKNLPGSYTELYFQFGIYFPNPLPSNNNFFQWSNAGNILGSLVINSSGKIDVYTGNQSSLVATGNIVLHYLTWYCIEVHVKIDGSVGVIETRIDGNVDCTPFNGNTNYNSYGSINRLVWSVSNWQAWYWDDIVIYDTTGTVNNSWTRCLKIVALYPTSDGVRSQWTPTPSGSHWSCIDETSVNTTDYVSGTLGQEDFYGLSSLPAGSTYISFIQPSLYVRKNSYDYLQKIQTSVLSAGVTTYLSPTYPFFSWTEIGQPVLEKNPVTNSPWTMAEINALQLGIKPTS
jgi:hypothetical protein